MNAEKTDGMIEEINQYLTFTLGDEDFALDIGKVREVLDFTTITKVPRMPEFFSGVINLRGNVVPVIDLRYKLGIGAIEESVDTCIVIVEIMIDSEMIHVGALADSVKEVIDLEPSQISPPPKLGMNINNEFISGMGRQGEKFLMILDIDRVLAADKPDLIQKPNDVKRDDLSGQKADAIYNMPAHLFNMEQKSMAEPV